MVGSEAREQGVLARIGALVPALVLGLLMVLPGSLRAQDLADLLTSGVTLEDLKDAEGNYAIQGFGTIPAGATLDADFWIDGDGTEDKNGDGTPEPDYELTGGPYNLHPGADDNQIPSGTAIEDLDLTLLAGLSGEPKANDILLDLLGTYRGGPPDEIPPNATYKLIIDEIDSTEFPLVRVRFKAFPNDAATPPFDPTRQTAEITETVVFDKGAGREPDTLPGRAPPGESAPTITLCEKYPVAFALAIDTSCSVTSVLEGMKNDAADFFAARIAENAARPGKKDAAAFHTFDGRGLYRAPGDPNDETASSTEYVVLDPGQGDQFVDQVRGIPVGRPCLGSPIYEGMRRELLKLRDYTYPDPAYRDVLVRALVTFADYRDTEGPGDKQALIEEAKRSDVVLVYLGFGRVNVDGITDVESVTEGAFIQGADTDVPKVLDETYNALTRIYCVTYLSPHPNIVNETAEVNIKITNEAGGVSEASGKFPLPFVIPEDSTNVRMFIPLTEKDYEARTLDGPPSDTFATLQLYDAAGEVVETDRGPTRVKRIPLNVSPDTWAADHPDKGPGFFVDSSAGAAAWNDFFKTPTDYVDLGEPDPNAEPAIRDINHYRMDIRFGDPDAGQAYKGSPRVSIQDRTPPSLYVRIAPQDGSPPYEFTLWEEAVDSNPGFLPDADAPTYEAVKTAGSGAKAGRMVYSWRIPGNIEATGNVGGLKWYGGTGEAPTFDMVVPPDFILSQGVTMVARTRTEVTIHARDNYAVLAESEAPADQDAFDPAQPSDVDTEGPRYAQYDLNRPEAQLSDVRAPFLPHVPREELEADPAVPGLTWWIESHDPQDRFKDLEHLTEFTYSTGDEDVEAALAEDGVSFDDPTVRTLHIRAQDGHRNPVIVEIPIEILGTDFQAETLQFQSRRKTAGE